ncbi:hypothetical protein FQN54_000841 [Arachnomyces sp. PD_36]|nr:hypothetical protein FQN54_000841 [Arachnomyces sp. PD_36]
MASYALLDQADEDALHRSRLLNVEEKPFKRITKRLLTPSSLIYTPSAFPPTPPPDGSNQDEDDPSSTEAQHQKRLEEWRQFREDVTLDFAAFESSIARIQFLRTSNEKERERYAAEKDRIQSAAQAVRDNTAQLRIQLEEAQKTLALRKTYDDLAEKITSNRLLRPREDQQVHLEKLHTEIAELEIKSTEYAQTWSERREQFGRIVEEGMQLRRLIRDEKEEVERREGMEEGEDAEDGDAASKGRASSAAATPRIDQDGMTPSQQSQDEGGAALSSNALLGDKQLRPASAAGRGVSPLRQVTAASTPAEEKEKTPQEGEDEDTNMVDEGEITDDGEAGSQADSGSRTASGTEAGDPNPKADIMDTT